MLLDQSKRTETLKALPVVLHRPPILFIDRLTHLFHSCLLLLEFHQQLQSTLYESDLILQYFLLILVVHSCPVLVVPNLPVSEVQLGFTIQTQHLPVYLLDCRQILNLSGQVSDRKYVLHPVVGQLPPPHPHQQYRLQGHRVGLELYLVGHTQSLLLNGLEEVGVGLNVLTHSELNPYMLVEVVLEGKAVPDQQSSVGELAIAEVDLRVGLEASLFPGFHLEQTVTMLLLFFGFLVAVLVPAVRIGVGSALLSLYLLVDSSLTAVEAGQVSSVGVQVLVDFLCVADGLVVLPASSPVLVLDDPDLFDDLPQVDQGESFPLELAVHPGFDVPDGFVDSLLLFGVEVVPGLAEPVDLVAADGHVVEVVVRDVVLTVPARHLRL